MWRPEAWLAILAVLTGGACAQKMAGSGKLRPYDGTGRAPMPGTVAYDALPTPSPSAGEIPYPVTRAFLATGRKNFEIHCAPCHGFRGDGQGMIVQRGFIAPPTYHQDRLRASPPSHFVDVMTDGFGAMFSYADRLNVEERWAVAAYIQALQLSQNVPATELTDADRGELQ